jgi:putative redox protein
LIDNYFCKFTKKYMTASIIYEGELHCQATHQQSGTSISTDAPTDNRGRGAAFSPTDLVCTALATCILTTMAMKATDMGFELKGATASVNKIMKSDPRRIGRIEINLQLPALTVPGEKERTILQRTGDHCPVHRSIHPDTEMDIVYNWV